MTKEFLRTPFVTLTVGLVIILAYPILFFPKGELVILINTHNHPEADLYFKYFNNTGDGAVLAVLLVMLLF